VSPRAASRLDALGFPEVYDYAAGKADWGSYGLPIEGTWHSGRDRLRGADWDTCLAALGAETDVSIDEAMTLGPSTVRPSLELDRAVERMRTQNLTSLPVTRSDGVLVGVLLRADAELMVPALPEH
jgi:CBS domain-containing protein